MIRSPSFPYVAPFIAFFGFLALYRVLPLPALLAQAGFVAGMILVIALVARKAADLKHGISIRHWAGTVLIGAGVFVLWIAPDLVFPGYRHNVIFENPLTGSSQGDVQAGTSGQAAVLWLRAVRAVAIVPLVEELFWRAWMMRWIIQVDFLALPLGAWSARAFWIVAVLFAAEHGSFWDVGLATGLIYNWWMVRTRSLGDLVLAHAITNLCLSVYVVMTAKWEYWL